MLISTSRKTDSVAGQALKFYPLEHRAPMQIKLLQALARVECGDVIKGIRHAHITYTSMPPEMRTNMVSSIAYQVLRRVPPQQHQHPDVIVYQELLFA